jgi:hypothetical protein
MALVSTLSTKEARKFSFGGPLKCEIHTYTVGTGITSATVTAKNLSTVYHAFVDGLQSTALPVCSSNTAVLAFVDPAATVYGTILLIGV